MRTAKTAHLDEAVLLRHAAADLSRSAATSTRRHLTTCAACRKRFATAERVHRGLRAIAVQEKRSAQRVVARTRAAIYRETVGQVFSDVRKGERAGERLLKAARTGPDELAAAMRTLDGKPYRGFALLHAAKEGAALVGVDPRRALDLAHTIGTEAASLVEVNREARSSTPAPRQIVQAEAFLLVSQALVMMGEADAARIAATAARPLFIEAGDLGYGLALCDYFEGEAATFSHDYTAAALLIRSALTAFQEFGQDHFLARSEAAIGTIFENRGDYAEAIEYLDRAIAHFDAEKDARALTGALNNRADALARLSEFDEARATYARAMSIALQTQSTARLRYIRSGLAELDFLRGQYERALRAFREIASESAANGSRADVLFARLYVAECLGRMGQFDEMAAEVDSLRHDRRQTVFSPSPALKELFVCLDQGTIDADLVAHVREYLETEDRGDSRPYRFFRTA